jgi:DNA-binding CsgD family transcriptional regulator
MSTPSSAHASAPFPPAPLAPQAPVAGGSGLRGRTGECARLNEFVSTIRRGESRSLVVRGEAGIGKTALLEYLVASASELQVVRAAGVESEMELAYASLHRLCAPLFDRLQSLPAAQRQALEVVFGLSDGAPPDRFLVGLGVLSLVSEVAGERPLLCVVDDAQWLDQASALTLAFVARRLLVERVGIVFAAREPGEEFQHLPVLEVHGLRNGDARALLGSAVRFRLDERVRDRIIAETRGNPLALLELPRGLTEMQLAGGSGLVEAQKLTGRIEESFVRRLEPLPEDTRLLLLVAAAEPLGDPLLLWRAAEHLGIEKAAADDARSVGLVEIGERVTFRHPLVRSAVYRSAPIQERRTVHSALAAATDQTDDPDRRAWHLAAAATGPDEEVALELVRSADRAQARGGLAAAAAFLKRAVALTFDPKRRDERCLAAAQAHLQAGAFDEALRLLASAEAGAPTELGRAQVELLRGQIAFASTAGGKAPALLLKVARQLESLDVALARETYLDAWAAALFAGRFASAGGVDEVSRTATAAPRPVAAPRPGDLLLDGFSVLVNDGRAAAAPNLSRAAHVFAEGEINVAEELRWGYLAGCAGNMLWDEETTQKTLVRQVRSVRDAGFLSVAPIALHGLSVNMARRGDFAAAASLIAEGDAVVEATGTRFPRYAQVQLAALRGNEADAAALIEVELSNAAAAEQGIGIQWCQWLSAVLYNGLGRYEQALGHAQQASDAAPELFVSMWALPELVEAASRIERTQLAAQGIERLVEATSIGDSDWGLGILARSRALLAESQSAESLFREAIERLGRTQVRTELARAHLLYGEWLRREARRVDAREQLRTAREMLLAIGMEAFAERARKELLATGEKARKRTVETRDDLTQQELQIARMATEGLSNPEIGARLFLSPRTVEWHLRKVFGKLGVRSRFELAAALAGSGFELVQT